MLPLAVTRGASAALVAIGFSIAPVAFAQSSGNNPAATVNGAIPTSEGNVWNGQDHQPTEAEVPQGTAKQQEKVNKKLQTLDQQLMNAPLPKDPAGAPPVSGGD